MLDITYVNVAIAVNTALFHVFHLRNNTQSVYIANIVSCSTFHYKFILSRNLCKRLAVVVSLTKVTS